MRLYDIMLFTLILHLTSAYFYTQVAPKIQGMEGIGWKVETPTSEEVATAKKEFEERIGTSEVVSEDWLTKLVGKINDFIQSAITKVLSPLTNIIFAIPLTLQIVGIPSELAWLISTPIYVIEVFGIVQFATGRSLKEME